MKHHEDQHGSSLRNAEKETKKDTKQERKTGKSVIKTWKRKTRRQNAEERKGRNT